MNKKNYLIWLGAVLLASALLVACGSSPKPVERPVATVSGIDVQTVHLESLPETYEAVGTIASKTSSVLGAQMSATVREMRVKPGNTVQRGEVLAVLDDRSPLAQVSAAEAGVEASAQGLAEVGQAVQGAIAEREFAEVTYHRYRDLLAKNSVTRQEFDSAEARYKAAAAHEAALEARKKQMMARRQQARSEHASAETLFSYTRIVSPINGIVTAKYVDAGTLVMPGAPLLTVEDPAHYRLEVSLPEDLLTNIRPGESVPVFTDHGKFEGRVAEIVPAADPASRTVLVKLDLPKDCSCRSGQYGKADFPVGQEKRLTVPRSALVERGQLDGIFVVNGQGIAQYRLVETGKSFGDRVEVLSGLGDGERIAVSNVDRLQEGTRIEAP